VSEASAWGFLLRWSGVGIPGAAVYNGFDAGEQSNMTTSMRRTSTIGTLGFGITASRRCGRLLPAAKLFSLQDSREAPGQVMAATTVQSEEFIVLQ
jgi:hypothetical protein